MSSSRFTPNRFLAEPSWTGAHSAGFDSAEVIAVHRSLPEYQPTALRFLPGLATSLGLGQILVKDESTRFGLKAFKGLGSSYACYRFARKYLKQHSRPCPPAGKFYQECATLFSVGELTFCTATDGNHGRGVAWAAQKLSQKAVIYMPEGTVPARIAAIQAEGAEVIVVKGNYDQAVTECSRDAAINGWAIISDTSWDGYEEIPRWIMAGYLTMFAEMDVASGEDRKIDLIFVPGGVGALAATAAWYFRQSPDHITTRLVTVEPVEAACLLESIESPDGAPVVSAGRQDSIMAGLNCPTPSPVAWPMIRNGYDGFMAANDDTCREAMRTYYHPIQSDPRVIAGESGAATLAGLLALTTGNSLASARQTLALDSDCTVLLLNTEGDTDPDHFAKVVANEPAGHN